MTRAAIADVPDRFRSQGSGMGETRASWISWNPDGSKDACIRETTIPVWVLVHHRRLGGSEEALLRDYPSLTPADLQVAWNYAGTHCEEIDRAIEENQSGPERPSLLPPTLPTDLASALAYLQGAEWRQKNARRVQLIDREVKGCLADKEESELDQLQQEMSALLKVAHPQPVFDSDKLEAIKKRLQGGNNP